ncbi:MAG: restriction endonuclease [Caldilineaceae bacterium]
MDPIAFERFVGQHFAKMGYKVENTRASGDEGIDLIIRSGRRMAVVQCKRYGGTVGQPVVRDLYGVMVHTGADEAYLVTTGTLSRAAVDWAAGKPIHLVDGHRLVEWTRTGRLNYDHKPQLSRTNRQMVMLVGLALLAMATIYLSSPQTQAQVQQWQQTVMSWLPVTATDTPTDVPAPTADPTSAPATETPAPSTEPTAIPQDTPTAEPTPLETAPSARPTWSPRTPEPPAGKIQPPEIPNPTE